MSRLDEFGIEAFCDAVIEGKSYRNIAGELGISAAYVVKWLSADSERSARAREARRISSQSFDEMALETLRDPDIEPQRAREIASHLRWRASKIAPNEYGDKIQVDTTIKHEEWTDAQIEAQRVAIAERLQGMGLAAPVPLIGSE